MTESLLHIREQEGPALLLQGVRGSGHVQAEDGKDAHHLRNACLIHYNSFIHYLFIFIYTLSIHINSSLYLPLPIFLFQLPIFYIPFQVWSPSSTLCPYPYVPLYFLLLHTLSSFK